MHEKLKMAFKAGDRVITKNQERGTLIQETFSGHWKGYQMGWWVRFDNDYTTRVLSKHLIFDCGLRRQL